MSRSRQARGLGLGLGEIGWDMISFEGGLLESLRKPTSSLTRARSIFPWRKLPPRRWSGAVNGACLGALLAQGAPLGLWIWLKLMEPIDERAALAIYGYLTVSTTVVFTAFGFITGRIRDQLRAQTIRDPLTGLYNRRYLDEIANWLWASSKRRSEPMCVLLADLDHFKNVNDTYGHEVGDQTLRAVAEVLSVHARQTDIVFRVGGEEFLIVCPNTDQASGFAIAERLRERVSVLGKDKLGFSGRQTISLGIATWQPDSPHDVYDLLSRADVALYQAKGQGRNQVAISEEPASNTSAAQLDAQAR